jgi:quinol monooxygenase YgiN
MRVKHEKMHEFLSIARRDVGPSLANEKGLRRFYLIRSLENMNEFVALTLWNSQREAASYEKSGRYARNVSKIRDMLEAEPVLTQYHVELHSVGGSVAKRPARRARSR